MDVPLKSKVHISIAQWNTFWTFCQVIHKMRNTGLFQPRHGTQWCICQYDWRHKPHNGYSTNGHFICSSFSRGQWLLSNHIHIISTKHICPRWQLTEYREFLVNPPHRQQWANHKRISHTADSELIFESILWDVNHIINIIAGWRPFLI